MSRSLVSGLALALLLALPACSNQQPVLQAPVVQTGTPAPLVPSKETPDEPLKQLGLLGTEVATLLGQDLGRLVAVTRAYYDAYDKYPKAYRVQNFSGWEFRQGWFWSADNSEDLTLRARFESQSGLGPDWDVTFDGNYGEDFHPAFPNDLARVRYEYDRKLSNGGRMALTLFTELGGDRQTPLTMKASGSAYAPTTLGQVGFEALNGTYKADGTFEKGDLTLKSQFEGITRQFAGQYGPQGLIGRAKMSKSLHPVGEVSQVEGKWLFQNEAGSFPLQ